MDAIKHKQGAADNKLFWVFGLSSAIYFIQGIETLPSQSLFYYLKESLKFSPQKIMVISSLITFAWLVKPVIGYVIDNFWNKRAWIFISLALSAVLAAIVGLNHLPLKFLIGALIISSAWAAFRDVSIDGIMCIEGKKHNATGKIQSVQWISISVATLATGIGGGYIAEKWSYTVAFLCLIPFYIAALAFTYLYKTKEPMRSETTSKFIRDMKTLLRNKKLLMAGLFCLSLQLFSVIRHAAFFHTKRCVQMGQGLDRNLELPGHCFCHHRRFALF